MRPFIALTRLGVGVGLFALGVVALAAPINPAALRPVTPARLLTPSAVGKKVFPKLVVPKSTKLVFAHGLPLTKVGSPLRIDGISVLNGHCGLASPGALVEFKGVFGERAGQKVFFTPNKAADQLRSISYAPTGRVPLSVSLWTKDKIQFPVPGIRALGCKGETCEVLGTVEIVGARSNLLASVPGIRLGSLVLDFDGDSHNSLEAGGDDCDDCDGGRYPGNTEVPDPERDEDCNPDTFGCADADRDRWCDARACNRQPSGALYCADADDCNDSNPSVHPAQVDVCNGIDDNCDGLIDEDLINCPTSQRPRRAP